MDSGALEVRRKLAFVTAGYGVLAGVALILGFWFTSCASLPSAACMACQHDCPGDLECREGLCIRPGHADDCPEASTTSIAVGSTTGGGGEGGLAISMLSL